MGCPFLYLGVDLDQGHLVGYWAHLSWAELRQKLLGSSRLGQVFDEPRSTLTVSTYSYCRMLIVSLIVVSFKSRWHTACLGLRSLRRRWKEAENRAKRSHGDMILFPAHSTRTVEMNKRLRFMYRGARTVIRIPHRLVGNRFSKHAWSRIHERG